MAQTVIEELVYATTDDDVSLAGIAIRPANRPTQPISIVWIHGNAATFSDRPYVLVGRALAALGYPVLIGNTRGHDIAATLWRASDDTPSAGGGGAGWERMEDAPRDLAAWVALAAGEEASGGGVALVGHSKGAQKVILAAAERPEASLVGVALASPDVRGFRMPGELEAARQLVADGRGAEVTPATPWAPWYRQSAQTVVSHADAQTRIFTADDTAADGRPAIAALTIPLLAFYGAQEQSGQADLDMLRHAAINAPRIETATIAETGHFYTGHEAEVAGVIAQWAAGLV